MDKIYITINEEGIEFNDIKSVSVFMGVNIETVKHILKGITKRNPCNVRYLKNNGITTEKLEEYSCKVDIVKYEYLNNILVTSTLIDLPSKNKRNTFVPLKRRNTK